MPPPYQAMRPPMRKKCRIFKLLKPPKHQLRGYHWMLFYLSTITILGTLYLALYNTRSHPFFVIQSQVFLYLFDQENLFTLSSSFFVVLALQFCCKCHLILPIPTATPRLLSLWLAGCCIYSWDVFKFPWLKKSSFLTESAMELLCCCC